MYRLDLERLAFRIERLQRQSTHRWNSSDALEFHNLLPGGRDRRAIPSPEKVRGMDPKEAAGHWRLWITMVLRMEGLVQDNRPGNMKRIMRDMARGYIGYRN